VAKDYHMCLKAQYEKERLEGLVRALPTNQ